MGRPKKYNFANEAERKAHIRAIARCTCGYHNKSRPNHICEDFLVRSKTDEYGIYNVENKQYLRYRYTNKDGKRTAICIGYKKRGIDEARKIIIERINELKN